MRRFALPPLCLLCSAPAVSSNICAQCRDDLIRLPGERCPRCAEPTLGGETCGACLAHSPSFDRVLVAHAYAFPLDRLIQSFKYSGNLPAAPLLAELMQEAIGEATLPDVIVPMPLSAQRLRERGFNQSLELARILGSQTGVPVDHEACVRLRHGEAQSSLPWGQRAANVRGRIRLHPGFQRAQRRGDRRRHDHRSHARGIVSGAAPLRRCADHRLDGCPHACDSHLTPADFDEAATAASHVRTYDQNGDRSMTTQLRGADALAQALARAGTRYLFSLSGNQIMPVYDAAIDAKLDIIHVRHEGAAVHMADAWGRLTGTPGIALVTGGPGHANAIGALYTALSSDSPLVFLSGHAPLNQLGTDAFQEMRQADMAAPVVKASWTAQSAPGSVRISRAPSTSRFPGGRDRSTSACRSTCSKPR
jgi:predicted amidophosphoribosyltransferase